MFVTLSLIQPTNDRHVRVCVRVHVCLRAGGRSGGRAVGRVSFEGVDAWMRGAAYIGRSQMPSL